MVKFEKDLEQKLEDIRRTLGESATVNDVRHFAAETQ
jgi:hypothetical protein